MSAEAAISERPTVRVMADQLRELVGAQACWLGFNVHPAERSGSRAGDAVARSLLSATLADGRARTRGDLVAASAHDGADVAGVVLRLDAGSGECQRLAGMAARWILARRSDLNRHDLDARAARAELRALRAQISPHFTFNALGAIAAMMRIDPDQARALLLDLADYTRYSFGRHGDYTTLSEELRAVDTYLALETARFGGRLRVRVLVPPELLGVPVPFLMLQPLVENAVRHAVETRSAGATVSVTAVDEGHNVCLAVEDDGPGMEPSVLESLLGAPEHDASTSGFALRNIDERLRATYGDAHGLVMETAVGEGMRITMRIPKYHPAASPARLTEAS